MNFLYSDLIQLFVLKLVPGLLTSAEVGLWFLLSVFLSPSAASVGHMAVGASRQPLLRRARDGPADSLVFLAAGLNATGTVLT